MKSQKQIEADLKTKEKELTDHLRGHQVFVQQAKQTMEQNKIRFIQLKAEIKTLQSLLPKKKI